MQTNRRKLHGAYPGTLEPDADLRAALPLGYLIYGPSTDSPQPPGAIEIGNPDIYPFDTAMTAIMSADGLTWANQPTFVFDEFGNIIINVQRSSGGTRNLYVYSNGDGLDGTWVDNDDINDFGTIGEIGDRWSFVYDQANTSLHGVFTAESTGPIYRRYDITYSGQNITGILWDRATTETNAVLDDGADLYSHPICLKHGSKIIAIYSIVSFAGLSEIRAVMVDISGDINAGGDVGNWTHIGFSSTSAMSVQPNTASFSVITSHASAGSFDQAAFIAANNDIVFVYYKNNNFYMRRAIWSGSNWGSLGSEVLLTNRALDGDDTGYGLKKQLITRPCEIDSKIYVAYPVWVDDTDGDGVILVEVDGASVNYYVVNVAGGAHTYAPTTDLTKRDDRLIISYLKSGGAGTFARVFDGLTPAQDEVLLFDDFDADIPLLADQDTNADQLLVMFRKVGSPPQPGYVGTIDYV